MPVVLVIIVGAAAGFVATRLMKVETEITLSLRSLGVDINLRVLEEKTDNIGVTVFCGNWVSVMRG